MYALNTTLCRTRLLLLWNEYLCVLFCREDLYIKKMMMRKDEDFLFFFFCFCAFEFKNWEKGEPPCFLAAWWWIEKSNREEILTAPSFRVLYETLNTRVKKKLREREREKRKDHQERVFSFFTESEKKKRQTFFWHFFYILFIRQTAEEKRLWDDKEREEW